MVRAPSGGNVAGCRAGQVVPTHVPRQRRPQPPAPHARALWIQPIRCRLVVVRRTSVALPQTGPTGELPGDFSFGDTRKKIKRYSGLEIKGSRPTSSSGVGCTVVFALKKPWMLNPSTALLDP